MLISELFAIAFDGDKPTRDRFSMTLHNVRSASL